MTKKEWNKFKLQLALGKKPKETFILSIRGHGYDTMYCSSCKNEPATTDGYCKKCDFIFIETIDREGKIQIHPYKTKYYPKEFSDD